MQHRGKGPRHGLLPAGAAPSAPAPVEESPSTGGAQNSVLLQATPAAKVPPGPPGATGAL